ncbi:membrane integrity-associated transporter subunit PqiC [Trinickia sp. EG282A]|uniref:membrane integrity-associated transporter subunit PqiC n=1 Tax=Trinickia sp. EG282A TaxID=3237013 RepID=UPI0034D31492
MNLLRVFALAIALDVFAVACTTSPAARFYTLSPVQLAEPRRGVKPIAIAIGPVTVPDLVDRPQIVSTIDANRVSIDEFARWADPLKSQIGRALAEDLMQLIPGSVVSVYPQRASGSGYGVSVDVQSFDSPMGGGEVTLAVIWSVRPPRGSAVDGRSVVREAVTGVGYDALVNAHSRALASVAKDIAAATQSALAQRN